MDTERADQKWMRWRKQSSKCCWNKHPATNSPREGTHPPFQSPTHHSDELQSSTINLSSNSHALLTPKLQAKHSPRSPGAAELQQLVSYLKEGTSRVKAVAAEGLHRHLKAHRSHLKDEAMQHAIVEACVSMLDESSTAQGQQQACATLEDLSATSNAPVVQWMVQLQAIPALLSIAQGDLPTSNRTAALRLLACVARDDTGSTAMLAGMAQLSLADLLQDSSPSIVRGALVALYYLGADKAEAQVAICHTGVVPHLLAMCSSKDSSNTHQGAEVIKMLCKSRACCQAVVEAGGAATLSSLAHPNPLTSTSSLQSQETSAAARVALARIQLQSSRAQHATGDSSPPDRDYVLLTTEQQAEGPSKPLPFHLAIDSTEYTGPVLHASVPMPLTARADDSESSPRTAAAPTAAARGRVGASPSTISADYIAGAAAHVSLIRPSATRQLLPQQPHAVPITTPALPGKELCSFADPCQHNQLPCTGETEQEACLLQCSQRVEEVHQQEARPKPGVSPTTPDVQPAAVPEVKEWRLLTPRSTVSVSGEASDDDCWGTPQLPLPPSSSMLGRAPLLQAGANSHSREGASSSQGLAGAPAAAAAAFGGGPLPARPLFTSHALCTSSLSVGSSEPTSTAATPDGLGSSQQVPDALQSAVRVSKSSTSGAPTDSQVFRSSTRRGFSHTQIPEEIGEDLQGAGLPEQPCTLPDSCSIPHLTQEDPSMQRWPAALDLGSSIVLGSPTSSTPITAREASHMLAGLVGVLGGSSAVSEQQGRGSAGQSEGAEASSSLSNSAAIKQVPSGSHLVPPSRHPQPGIIATIFRLQQAAASSTAGAMAGPSHQQGAPVGRSDSLASSSSVASHTVVRRLLHTASSGAGGASFRDEGASSVGGPSPRLQEHDPDNSLPAAVLLPPAHVQPASRPPAFKKRRHVPPLPLPFLKSNKSHAPPHGGPLAAIKPSVQQHPQSQQQQQASVAGPTGVARPLAAAAHQATKWLRGFGSALTLSDLKGSAHSSAAAAAAGSTSAVERRNHQPLRPSRSTDVPGAGQGPAEKALQGPPLRHAVSAGTSFGHGSQQQGAGQQGTPGSSWISVPLTQFPKPGRHHGVKESGRPSPLGQQQQPSTTLQPTAAAAADSGGVPTQGHSRSKDLSRASAGQAGAARGPAPAAAAVSAFEAWSNAGDGQVFVGVQMNSANKAQHTPQEKQQQQQQWHQGPAHSHLSILPQTGSPVSEWVVVANDESTPCGEGSTAAGAAAEAVPMGLQYTGTAGRGRASTACPPISWENSGGVTTPSHALSQQQHHQAGSTGHRRGTKSSAPPSRGRSAARGSVIPSTTAEACYTSKADQSGVSSDSRTTTAAAARRPTISPGPVARGAASDATTPSTSTASAANNTREVGRGKGVAGYMRTTAAAAAKVRPPASAASDASSLAGSGSLHGSQVLHAQGSGALRGSGGRRGTAEEAGTDGDTSPGMPSTSGYTGMTTPVSSHTASSHRSTVMAPGSSSNSAGGLRRGAATPAGAAAAASRAAAAAGLAGHSVGTVHPVPAGPAGSTVGLKMSAATPSARAQSPLSRASARQPSPLQRTTFQHNCPAPSSCSSPTRASLLPPAPPPSVARSGSPATVRAASPLQGLRLAGRAGSGGLPPVGLAPAQALCASPLVKGVRDSDDMVQLLQVASDKLGSFLLRPEDVSICRGPDGRRVMLGEGGFGVVYKGLQNGVDEVAVKVAKKAAPSRRELELFISEVSLLSRLHHRNIVQAYGVVLQPGKLSLVTELMRGGDMYHSLRHHPHLMRWDCLGRKVALDIALGLNHLHCQSPPLMHRDLKSPNVLLSEEGVAKIADVGMSRAQEAELVSAQPIMTPLWSAPEVVNQQPSSIKCDVWSFGVLVWELATGLDITEYQALAVSRQLSLTGPKTISMPQDAPPVARMIFDACTQMSPQDRPTVQQVVSWLRSAE